MILTQQKSTGISNSTNPNPKHHRAISQTHSIMPISVFWNPLGRAIDLFVSFGDEDDEPLVPKTLFEDGVPEFFQEHPRKSYNVERVHYVYPFFFLSWSRITFPEIIRPFTIAGALAIWGVPKNLDLLMATGHGFPTYTSNGSMAGIMSHVERLVG